MPGRPRLYSGEEGELVVHPKGLGPPLDGFLRGPPRHPQPGLFIRLLGRSLHHPCSTTGTRSAPYPSSSITNTKNTTRQSERNDFPDTCVTFASSDRPHRYASVSLRPGHTSGHQRGGAITAPQGTPQRAALLVATP